MGIRNVDPTCAFPERVVLGDVITTIDGRKMCMLEDTRVGREWAREFGIVRRASAVASAMVDNATNGGAPLADADKSPVIALDCNGDGNGISNGCASASARGGGAL
jgi:hypothetical protein